MSDRVQITVSKDTFLIGIYQPPTERAAKSFDETLVIMAHGFPGQKSGQNNLFGDLEFILNGRGFHTLRFDFRGCGESDGNQKDFSLKSANEDFEAVLKWAQNLRYKKLIYISEGLGSAVCIMNMTPNLLCQIMLWPALDLKFIAKSQYKAESYDEDDKQRGYQIVEGNHVGASLLRQMNEVKFGNYLRDVTMPTLIMQGSEDQVFPIGQLDVARKYMSSKRIEITTFHGGGTGLAETEHRKMLGFQTLDFIKKYI